MGRDVRRRGWRGGQVWFGGFIGTRTAEANKVDACAPLEGSQCPPLHCPMRAHVIVGTHDREEETSRATLSRCLVDDVWNYEKQTNKWFAESGTASQPPPPPGTGPRQRHIHRSTSTRLHVGLLPRIDAVGKSGYS